MPKVVARITKGATFDGIVAAEDVSGNGRAITFVFPEEDLSAAVFMPRPSWRLLDKFPAPTAEANQRFTVSAGTPGSGANSDVVLESAVSPFNSWTIQATIVLDASQEVEIDGVFTSDWVWNPATEKLRVRCSLMDAGTAPRDVVAIFDYA